MWRNLLAEALWNNPAYALAAALVLLVTVGVLALRHSAKRGLARLVQPDLHEGGGSTLVVLVHGQVRTLKWVQATLKLIAQARPDADVLFLKYPSHPTSNADAFQIAEQICHCINRQFGVGKYGSIILVGYSRGALL